VGVLAEEFVVPLRRLLEACPTVTLPAEGINQALDVLTCEQTTKAVRTALEWLQERKAGADSELMIAREKVKLLPPVRPAKLFCLAGNFMSHPPSTTLRGDGEPIVLSRSSTFVDYEAEMAVVIGKAGRHISADEAMQYVVGITCFNDVSERRLSIWPVTERSPWDRFFDWLNGKWMDGFAPMGPCVVPISEVDDIHNLRIRLYLNDQLMQDASTSDMIFSVPQTIEYLSHVLTLERGDVITMGTPSGVGFPRGVQLHDGDVVRVELEGVGVLTNPVVAE